jgi:hypothetical protein
MPQVVTKKYPEKTLIGLVQVLKSEMFRGETGVTTPVFGLSIVNFTRRKSGETISRSIQKGYHL